ncbi:MAG: hypothetical protein JNL81_08375 [Hyphomonadaceae bacterium]|nr:hypothetical protein [Hyphomonadaceae bacterium]
MNIALGFGLQEDLLKDVDRGVQKWARHWHPLSRNFEDDGRRGQSAPSRYRRLLSHHAARSLTSEMPD